MSEIEVILKRFEAPDEVLGPLTRSLPLARDMHRIALRTGRWQARIPPSGSRRRPSMVNRARNPGVPRDREDEERVMNDRRPVGMILHEKADRMYVICSDGTAYSAKVGHPGIVMGWHEIDPIPGTPAWELSHGVGIGAPETD